VTWFTAPGCKEREAQPDEQKLGVGMQVSIVENPVAAMGGAAPRDRVSRLRLWPSLVKFWLRRAERETAEAVQWVGHPGVLEDFRYASRPNLRVLDASSHEH
jgi:hypothetical protein